MESDRIRGGGAGAVNYFAEFSLNSRFLFSSVIFFQDVWAKSSGLVFYFSFRWQAQEKKIRIFAQCWYWENLCAFYSIIQDLTWSKYLDDWAQYKKSGVQNANFITFISMWWKIVHSYHSVWQSEVKCNI